MANDDDIADAFSSPANKNSKSSLSARSKSGNTSKSGYQRPPYITQKATINDLNDFVEPEEEKKQPRSSSSYMMSHVLNHIIGPIFSGYFPFAKIATAAL